MGVCKPIRMTGGKKVVPSYQASTCAESYGNNVRTCGCSFETCMMECGTRTPAIELIKCMFGCHHQ
ncbi:hypothetical protein DPMN_105192 [Dreissena polymorpha]|uniref:Uncharacterized protein n=1 Tax=Dreissena polymorpha TaxID=45954 RepID=A0A9D4K0Q1_DREPO|nr:hypothetical protein DPMN_105192 [Dreissena polymorpha]